MKIYTKTGDKGETGLFGGQRVGKNDLRVKAYGEVDELNALLGLAQARIIDNRVSLILRAIQSDLFTVGADLATPEGVSKSPARLKDKRNGRLEELIDEFDADLPALKNFILPGGTEAAATLQVGRTVCRRAERSVVDLAEIEEINPAILVYLNRLSDLLFVLARWQNHEAGAEEPRWEP
jgi:cob(I)alamin adenosyltransferase